MSVNRRIADLNPGHGEGQLMTQMRHWRRLPQPPVDRLREPLKNRNRAQKLVRACEL